MNDIKQKLDSWVAGTNTIVASPDTIKKLQNQGLDFKTIPAKTLDELFAEKKKAADERVPLLPPIPEELDLPHAVKSLYQEIRECIVMSLNGAAITLCGNLIEFVLKHVTFIKEQGGYQNYDSDKWDTFEEMDLSAAIGRAKKNRLLESKMSKRLAEFRADIRNPYSHFNIKKITQHVVARKVKVVDIVSGAEDIRDICAKDDPSIQALVKPKVDSRNVLNVFRFTDEVIRYLVNKLAEMETPEYKKATSEKHIEDVNTFCDYFLKQIETIPSEATNLQKKLILSCLIDTFGRAAFPSEGNQKVRFANLINTFACWDLRNQVSMQQAVLRMTERKLNNSKVCEELATKLGVWQTGNVMRAVEDPHLKDLLAIVDSDQEKKAIQSCLHTELFYQYRNRLVHELREPGYGIELSDDDASPYYHSEDNGVWQLVYPVGLFETLARQAIDNLRAHWLKSGVNPYDGFTFGSGWTDK